MVPHDGLRVTTPPNASRKPRLQSPYNTSHYHIITDTPSSPLPPLIWHHDLTSIFKSIIINDATTWYQNRHRYSIVIPWPIDWAPKQQPNTLGECLAAAASRMNWCNEDIHGWLKSTKHTTSFSASASWRQMHLHYRPITKTVITTTHCHRYHPLPSHHQHTIVITITSTSPPPSLIRWIASHRSARERCVIAIRMTWFSKPVVEWWEPVMMIPLMLFSSSGDGNSPLYALYTTQHSWSLALLLIPFKFSIQKRGCPAHWGSSSVSMMAYFCNQALQ